MHFDSSKLLSRKQPLECNPNLVSVENFHFDDLTGDQIDIDHPGLGKIQCDGRVLGTPPTFRLRRSVEGGAEPVAASTTFHQAESQDLLCKIRSTFSLQGAPELGSELRQYVVQQGCGWCDHS